MVFTSKLVCSWFSLYYLLVERSSNIGGVEFLLVCNAPICCPSPCWHSYTSSKLSYWSAFWILKGRKPDSRDVIFLFTLFSGREHLLSSSISTDLKKLKLYLSPFHPKHFLFHPYCPLIPVSAVSPVRVSTITVIRFIWWLFHSFCFSSYLVSLYLGETKGFLYEGRVSLKPLVTTALFMLYQLFIWCGDMVI